jgi:hypothetical protein
MLVAAAAAGLHRKSEKRKVGGLTPPLTTNHTQG